LGISLSVIFLCLFLAMRIWCGHGINERISIAKQQYSGIAEDALIAYLQDTTHTPQDRSDVAIWTLGQIRSKKHCLFLTDFIKMIHQVRPAKGTIIQFYVNMRYISYCFYRTWLARC